MKGQLFPFWGNPVYLGVPFLFRRIWKKEGGAYYYHVNIM